MVRVTQVQNGTNYYALECLVAVGPLFVMPSLEPTSVQSIEVDQYVPPLHSVELFLTQTSW